MLHEDLFDVADPARITPFFADPEASADLMFLKLPAIDHTGKFIFRLHVMRSPAKSSLIGKSGCDNQKHLQGEKNNPRGLAPVHPA